MWEVNSLKVFAINYACPLRDDLYQVQREVRNYIFWEQFFWRLENLSGDVVSRARGRGIVSALAGYYSARAGYCSARAGIVLLARSCVSSDMILLMSALNQSETSGKKNEGNFFFRVKKLPGKVQ